MSDSITMKEALMLDISDLRHQLAAALRERDEAREAFHEMEDQRDFAMSEMERLQRERDEAREENLEQARLLAISADREEKLRARFRELVQHAKDLDARYERCLKESNARLGDALEYRKERDEARKALQS